MPRLTPSNETNLSTASNVLRALTSEKVLKDADLRLQHSPYPQLWKVICEFHEGVLTLRGMVSSYFLKQLAYATVANVDGVKEVSDRLEVRNLQPKCWADAQTRNVT